MVCSAAESVLDCGALTTITPRGGGGLDVDVVEPDAGPADDDQVGAGGEHLGGDLGGGADDEGVGARQRLEQLLGGEAELHVDLVAGVAQTVEAAFGDLLGDQDSHPTILPRPCGTMRASRPERPRRASTVRQTGRRRRDRRRGGRRA